MPPTDNSIVLRDGRRLGYALYGPPAGAPVVYFHGTPGSRLNPFLEGWGNTCGIRFIAIDRPGFGLSTFYRERSMLDIAVDVGELCDQLGLDEFRLAGISGGGPPVLACAHGLGRRVLASLIVSGGGPPEAPRAGMNAENLKALANAEKHPDISALAKGPIIRLVRRFPEYFIKFAPNSMPPADRAVVTRPDVRQIYVDGMRNAQPGDGRAALYEFRLYGRPWGFDLGEIDSYVELWHGDADESVPLGMAAYIAEKLPHGALEVVAGAGHLLVFDRWREIFTGWLDRTSLNPSR